MHHCNIVVDSKGQSKSKLKVILEYQFELSATVRMAENSQLPFRLRNQQQIHRFIFYCVKKVYTMQLVRAQTTICQE